MLPKPGIYYFPWEVSAGQVPDGGSLRTFGRLELYDMTQSRVTLGALRGSEKHQVLVCTELVEPFQAQVGSLYMVLGELDHQKDVGAVVKARVLTCVEGMNLPLLEQAIQEQRTYQQQRDKAELWGQGPPAPWPWCGPWRVPEGNAQQAACWLHVCTWCSAGEGPAGGVRDTPCPGDTRGRRASAVRRDPWAAPLGSLPGPQRLGLAAEGRSAERGKFGPSCAP
ncbi:PREDICTED: CST complex subunit TEN1 [Elephantulus edwardii]|uniref:CST complex subunit TEN1 n=1 Tax=Elephantulus edwardii TaxID=28737 RepID=UPI0003F09001|nr:PREDICTED: CST complex subunit TEN1 [Elephantulus edwardii]